LPGINTTAYFAAEVSGTEKKENSRYFQSRSFIYIGECLRVKNENTRESYGGFVADTTKIMINSIFAAALPNVIKLFKAVISFLT
jgi:hypothetical protein